MLRINADVSELVALAGELRELRGRQDALVRRVDKRAPRRG
jgi:hypothetical protein